MKQLAYILILLAFSTCKKENALDCFKGNGREISETRPLQPFDQVLVTDKFEVHVFQSQEFKVEVICGKNIIRNIETVVNDGVLTLSNHNKCNFVRGYKRQIRIHVFLPRIKLLVNDHVGVVTIDENYSQDSISVRVASSGDLHLNGTYRAVKTSSNSNGDMYLSGKTDKLWVFTTGVNYVQAKNMRVKDYMFIHTVTMGDCFVNADGTRQFDYNIQKSGNIYYTGEPQAIGNFSEPGSTGKLLKN